MVANNFQKRMHFIQIEFFFRRRSLDIYIESDKKIKNLMIWALKQDEKDLNVEHGQGLYLYVIYFSGLLRKITTVIFDDFCLSLMSSSMLHINIHVIILL